MDIINLLLDLAEQGGMIALLIVIVIALGYYIFSKTVSKEQYEQNNKKIDELRTEFRDTVGPTLDRMARIMEKQDQINNNLIRHVDTQQNILSEMYKDISVVSHELKMQRLEGRKSGIDDKTD